MKTNKPVEPIQENEKSDPTVVKTGTAEEAISKSAEIQEPDLEDSQEDQASRTELRLKKWDLALKVVIPIVTVAVGIWQFSTQQTKLEELRFKSEHWLKRFDTYTRLTQSIATVNTALLDTAYDKEKLRSKVNQFEILYWESLLVEDSELRPVLNSFKDDLDRLRLLSQNSNPDAIRNATDIAVRDGYNVIEKCKQSINKYLPTDIAVDKKDEK